MTDTMQAGLGGALIDQHGHFIYYAIHVNPAFLTFFKGHGLTTLAGIQSLDPNLEFPNQPTDPKIMELKSAWMIVEDPRSVPTYFVVRATIPRYVVLNGVITQEVDEKTHNPLTNKVWVALIALHVVFTLPGHPEMIWSTFEHIHFDDKGHAERDNAPAALSNPSSTPPSTKLSKDNFPLYKRDTTAVEANTPVDGKTMARFWDSQTQSFKKDGTSIPTSVYRPYPGSKTDKDPVEDDEVIQINDNATKMFCDSKTPESDKRQYYRLVGAIWLNNPVGQAGLNPTFAVGRSYSNPISQSTDDADSDLAGEGRLASTAMESFTEFEEDKPGGSPNCFSCHDTSTVRRVDNSRLLGPAKLNVSHVLSHYIDLSTPAPK